MMVLSECRQLLADKTIIEARLVHDFFSAGWGINFIDAEGNEYPITDTYGIPCSYDSLKQAENIVHQVGDCPVHVDSLFRFSER